MTTLCFQFIYFLCYFHILRKLAPSWGPGGLNAVNTKEQSKAEQRKWKAHGFWFEHWLRQPGSTRNHFTHIILLTTENNSHTLFYQQLKDLPTNFTLVCISAKDVFWIGKKATLGQFQPMCPYKTPRKCKNIFLLCWWCPFLPSSDVFGVLCVFSSFWIVGNYVHISIFQEHTAEIRNFKDKESRVLDLGFYWVFLMTGWLGLGFY